jgi:hypothetical protein
MQLNLEFSASSDCTDILIEIYLNKNKIFESTAQQQSQQVLCEIDESPADHTLTLVMSGKNQSHTVVNDKGEITSDIYFTINRLEFEDLDMQEVFCLGKECYTHSFNSDQPEFLDEFYGIIGCNGTVNINFSTPIYLWLLDYL